MLACRERDGHHEKTVLCSRDQSGSHPVITVFVIAGLHRSYAGRQPRCDNRFDCEMPLEGVQERRTNKLPNHEVFVPAFFHFAHSSSVGCGVHLICGRFPTFRDGKPHRNHYDFLDILALIAEAGYRYASSDSSATNKNPAEAGFLVSDKCDAAIIQLSHPRYAS